jgi:ATP-dependent RNA helicase DeaD
MNSKLKFEDLGISADILAALSKKGFQHPTPIQEQTIPLLISGEKDIVAQAQTGTGKTAAFGIPILERITPGLGRVQAIVVAPTRELASQVAEELESLKANRDIRILPVYGGQGMDTQLRLLKKGVDIVVATPGRAIDHLKRKTLKLDHVQFVVLDEADEMLNMGFVDDIEQILSHVPEQRRMLLFSATMPPAILKLARKFMGDYDSVRTETKQQAAANVEQIFYEINEKDKLRALVRLIDTEPEFYALVFSRTRRGADRLSEKLSNMGLDVEALHGDISQGQRERILAKFKGGRATILIATDVAARGIDINDLSHVINFDLPESPEAYVHRIGRTGRAGKTGKAISFVAGGEWRKIQAIMRVTKTNITKGTLPSGNAVIELKRQAMAETVFAASDKEVPQEYHTLAQEILASGKPKQFLASLLQLHFGTRLDASAYPVIPEPDRFQQSWRRRDFESRPHHKFSGRSSNRGDKKPHRKGTGFSKKKSKSYAF